MSRKSKIGKIESAILSFMTDRQTCTLKEIITGVEVEGDGDTKTLIAQIRRSANNLVGKGILHHLKIDGKKGFTIDIKHIPKEPEPEPPEIAKPKPLPEGSIELLPNLIWSPSDAFGNENLVGVFLNRSPSCLWSCEWYITFADAQLKYPNLEVNPRAAGRKTEGKTPYHLGVGELARICSPNGDGRLNNLQMLAELRDMTRNRSDNMGRMTNPNRAGVEYILNHLNYEGDKLVVNADEQLRDFLEGERRMSDGPYWSPWSVCVGGAKVSKQCHDRGPGWGYSPADKQLILSGKPLAPRVMLPANLNTGEPIPYSAWRQGGWREGDIKSRPSDFVRENDQEKT